MLYDNMTKMEQRKTTKMEVVKMKIVVLPNRAKMVEHVQMESTVILARVYWATLETTVRQVRIWILREKFN